MMNQWYAETYRVGQVSHIEVVVIQRTCGVWQRIKNRQEAVSRPLWRIKGIRGNNSPVVANIKNRQNRDIRKRGITMDIDTDKNADSPLRVNVEGEELVIRIGINRLDGHDNHPEIPALTFEDRKQWVEDVIREIENGDEVGGTPLIYMLDKCMNEALEQGSIGVAEDSPTHIGDCESCGEDCVPLQHSKIGQVCGDCFKTIAE